MYQEPKGAHKTRYGIDFEASDTDFNIELLCWKHWREEPYRSGNIKDPHLCFIRAVRSKINSVPVLTDEEWGLSRWSEEHVYDWTNESNIICWGCAASSKSTDYGLLAYLDWTVDPNRTITMMASTSKEALRKRTFASVIHYYRLFRSKGLILPGVEVPSKDCILLSTEESETASLKTGVFGIAVKEGPVAEAVGRIRGMHEDHVRLLIDEMSSCPPAVWDPKLRLNLAVGTVDVKFIGLTNIDSFEDLAGRNSEPKAGWASVGPEVERWETNAGIVRRHDGFKSPAIVEKDGEKKYPYLLNQRTLDIMIKAEGGNVDSPAIWTMIRAYPPSVGNRPVLVSSTESVNWGMRADGGPQPVWRFPPTVAAGLDGGYGGDTCALQIVYVGMDDATGKYKIWFEPEQAVPIRAAVGASPVTDQILAYCLPQFMKLNLPPMNLGIDDSGPQGLADAFARAWSPAITRFSFGSRAGDSPVSAFNKQLASERYADCGTELGCLYREYGQYRQLLNVGPKCIRQLTSRETMARGGKLALLPKAAFKKMTGQRSPDEMDAGGLALGVVRYVVRLAPGATDITPMGPIEAYVNPDTAVDPAVVAAYNNLRSDYPDGR